MERSMSNENGVPGPFPSARLSVIDYPTPEVAEHDELESARSPTVPGSTRKRKRTPEEDGETIRSLRRSFEPCTRCRLKKLKCDLVHPRCGACSLFEVVCQQEDRHLHNKFQPGQPEMVGVQLDQAVCILKKFIPNYDPARATYFAAQAGVSVLESCSGSPIDGPQVHSPPTPPTLFGLSYALPPVLGAQKPLNSYPLRRQRYIPSHDMEVDNGNKGLDPRGVNMASPAAIARSFGVSSKLLPAPQYQEPEPLRVEDEDIPSNQGAAAPHPHFWQQRPFRRRPLPWAPHSISEMDMVWLPRSRKIADYLVDMYFNRLNFHRPIFEKNNYMRRFEDLYSTATGSIDDTGFICSTYLILALATLSELHQPDLNDAWVGELKADWPRHDDLFSRALAVKPDLRVTISSLQALLLLQRYLHSERYGCSLWRLVGTLVRLAIELGLQHDPMVQKDTFTSEECTLRVNLWHNVMIMDRGTSLLLGRPLAIGEDHFNTSFPAVIPGVVSRHFLDSASLNSVAADIVHSLYRPYIQPTEEVMQHSKRILISMGKWRKALPQEYTSYFHGTVGWPEYEKQMLRNKLTAEKGLTFLKYNIQRLSLLRAIFNNHEMGYDVCLKALDDAIKTSHNVITMHASLTQIPDIGFFVSPLPLHLAAITIIYGQSCGSTTISYETGYDDVHSALHTIQTLRCQWDCRDAGGRVHPITHELASRVFKRKPPLCDRPKPASVFMPEEDWEDDGVGSIPFDAQPGQWPSELFVPGRTWPNDHQIAPGSSCNESGSTRSAPIKQPCIPGTMPFPYDHRSLSARVASPAMHGPNKSDSKTEEEELTSIFAEVPEYAYGAINFERDTELQRLFMQEEKQDPTSRLDNGYKTGINTKNLEQLQHMGYSTIRL